MTQEAVAMWYLPGDNDQPRGPYTSDQVFAELDTSHITETTLCWCEGMPDWQPIDQVDPFALAIAQRRKQARKRVRTIALIAVGGLVITAGTIVAVQAIRGPYEVRQARKCMRGQLYADAVRILEPYVADHKLNDEAAYLLALARINDLVTSRENRPPQHPQPPFPNAQNELQRLLKADPNRAEQVRRDLADTTTRLSLSTGGSLEAFLHIAQLEHTLAVTPPDALAARLLETAARAPVGSQDHGMRIRLAMQAVQWNAALADEVAQSLIPPFAPGNTDPTAIPSGLSDLARQDDVLGAQLAARLSGNAEEAIAAGQAEEAIAYLNALTPLPVQQDAQAIAKRYMEVCMHNGEVTADTRRQALAHAMALDPAVRNSEQARWLDIELTTETGPARIDLLRRFIDDFPDSPHAHDARSMLLQCVLQDSAMARDDVVLANAYDTACDLAEAAPHLPDLDLHLFRLAEAHETAGEPAKAVHLLHRLCHIRPDSPKAADSRRLMHRMITSGVAISDLRKQAENAVAIQHLRLENAAVLLNRAAPGTVIRIGPDCPVSRLTAENRADLRQWVAGGGILWTTTDALGLFADIETEPLTPGQTMASTPLRTPRHPVLNGCWRVALVIGSNCRRIVHAPGRIALLEDESGTPLWSLVRVGSGWVSDVKDVDTTAADGDRFLAQFRLFCGNRTEQILPDPFADQRLRWIPERTRLEAEISKQAQQETLRLRRQAEPDPEDVARELALPWPLPEPDKTPDEVLADISSRIDLMVGRKFPGAEQHRMDLQKAASEEYPLYQLDTVVTIHRTQGVARTTRGVLRNVTGDHVIIGVRRIPLADIADDDVARLVPERNEKRRAAYVEQGMTRYNNQVDAFRRRLRAELTPQLFQQANYIALTRRLAGLTGIAPHTVDFAAPRDLHQRRMERLRIQGLAAIRDDCEAARTRIARTTFSSHGYVHRDGEWMPQWYADFVSTGILPQSQ